MFETTIPQSKCFRSKMFQNIDCLNQEVVNELGYFGVDTRNYLRRVGELNQVKREMAIMGVELGGSQGKTEMLNIAESFGFPVGTILDFAGTKCQGQEWNFGLEAHRLAAEKLVCQHSPLLILGTDVHLNAEELDRAQWIQVEEHLKFTKEPYDYQDEMGRYYLHEQAMGASTWW